MKRDLQHAFEKDARPYEAYIFNKEFLGQDTDKALGALLEKAQNEDGGYPGYFEPDIRSKNSAIISTKNALQLWLSMGTHLPAKVKKGVESYLTDKYDDAFGGWKIIGPEIQDAPRGVWWNLERVDGFGYVNPTAELLGLIRVFSLSLPTIDLELVEEKVQSYVREQEVLNEFDYLALRTYYDIVNEPLPKDLMVKSEGLIHFDSGDWINYVPGPSDIIDRPSHLLYEKYREEVDRHLDYLTNRLGQEGLLQPTWQWYQFEEEFPIAKKEWSGMLSLDLLRKLKRFNRLPFAYE